MRSTRARRSFSRNGFVTYCRAPALMPAMTSRCEPGDPREERERRQAARRLVDLVGAAQGPRDEVAHLGVVLDDEDALSLRARLDDGLRLHAICNGTCVQRPKT
jgi:hypothetical protein